VPYFALYTQKDIGNKTLFYTTAKILFICKSLLVKSVTTEACEKHTHTHTHTLKAPKLLFLTSFGGFKP